MKVVEAEKGLEEGMEDPGEKRSPVLHMGH
jgi:hypothetical protein